MTDPNTEYEMDFDLESQYEDRTYIEDESYDEEWDDDYEDEDEDTEPDDDPNVKFPSVKVKLIGNDGNAFAILGSVSQALRRAGATPEQVNQYRDEATSGDYNHLLATTMEWVVVW